MALGTVTIVRKDTRGGRKSVVADVQLTAGANYTTGGETISLAAVGMGHRIVGAIPFGLATTASGTTSRGVAFLFQSNGTVKMLVQTTASAEAASNSDQSTFTVRVEFVGH